MILTSYKGTKIQKMVKQSSVRVCHFLSWQGKKAVVDGNSDNNV